MSKPYMISYDLREPGQKYDELIKIIETFGYGISPQKSFWLIRTTLTIQQMADKINVVLDDNDALFICELIGNYRGRITDDEWAFIKKHIF